MGKFSRILAMSIDLCDLLETRCAVACDTLNRVRDRETMAFLKSALQSSLQNLEIVYEYPYNIISDFSDFPIVRVTFAFPDEQDAETFKENMVSLFTEPAFDREAKIYHSTPIFPAPRHAASSDMVNIVFETNVLVFSEDASFSISLSLLILMLSVTSRTEEKDTTQRTIV